MPFESSATATTATNSATYLVKRRLRIRVPNAVAAGAPSDTGDPASVRPCGVSGWADRVIASLLTRRHALVSCRTAASLAASSQGGSSQRNPATEKAGDFRLMSA